MLVAGGFLARRTGDDDEDAVERVVAERPIEAHEEAGEVFVWASAGVLAIAAAGVAGLAIRAGKLGGEIVYVHGAASAHAPRDAAAA